ncbi:host cell division inhibitor Icd-like protein [Providencia stuartii]|uniref:host cell division inhibitor Icd-like protein n=1 Tax=Providencia stuartii TaxID=588 RepID=UPI000CE65E14|nr:host cell division inhibitor Icd-like protein [Providencia stuartii]AVE42278.1 hypothetical protein AM353_10785 [Providencia stuartii]
MITLCQVSNSLLVAMGVNLIDSLNNTLALSYGIHHKISNDLNSPLQHCAQLRYSATTAPQWAVRRGNLNQLLATHDAPSVFFCVNAYAHLQAVLYRSDSMVALVGQPKGWLDSSNSSISTPASVTAPLERGNSGGDSLTKLLEAAIMAITPIQTHPKFTFYFLAVRRADLCAKPCRQSITAINERAARKMLVAEYVLFFAGRVPAEGVNHG